MDRTTCPVHRVEPLGPRDPQEDLPGVLGESPKGHAGRPERGRGRPSEAGFSSRSRTRAQGPGDDGLAISPGRGLRHGFRSLQRSVVLPSRKTGCPVRRPSPNRMGGHEGRCPNFPSRGCWSSRACVGGQEAQTQQSLAHQNRGLDTSGKSPYPHPEWCGNPRNRLEVHPSSEERGSVDPLRHRPRTAVGSQTLPDRTLMHRSRDQTRAGPRGESG